MIFLYHSQETKKDWDSALSETLIEAISTIFAADGQMAPTCRELELAAVRNQCPLAYTLWNISVLNLNEHNQCAILYRETPISA